VKIDEDFGVFGLGLGEIQNCGIWGCDG